MSSEEELPEAIIKAYELNRIDEFLGDEEIHEALVHVSRIVANPNISSKTAARLVGQLEGIAFNTKLKAKYYMFMGKGDDGANEKKNYYFSVSEALQRVVDSLKYVVKSY